MSIITYTKQKNRMLVKYYLHMSLKEFFERSVNEISAG